MLKQDQAVEKQSKNHDHVSIKCWLQLSEEERFTYLFQIETALEKDILSALENIDGHVTANGFDANKNNMIVIAKKVFKNEREFGEFVSQSPLTIELVN